MLHFIQEYPSYKQNSFGCFLTKARISILSKKNLKTVLTKTQQPNIAHMGMFVKKQELNMLRWD